MIYKSTDLFAFSLCLRNSFSTNSFQMMAKIMIMWATIVVRRERLQNITEFWKMFFFGRRKKTMKNWNFNFAVDYTAKFFLRSIIQFSVSAFFLF